LSLIISLHPQKTKQTNTAHTAIKKALKDLSFTFKIQHPFALN